MQFINDTHAPMIGGSEVINSSEFRYFFDGSWKESEKFLGIWWFCTLPNDDAPTKGTANHRRSLTFLHTKGEALVWVMKCMFSENKHEVVFITHSLTRWIWCLSQPSNHIFLHTWKKLRVTKECFLLFQYL